MTVLDVGVICPNIRRRDGQGRVMLEICRALCARGHRVHAYAATVAPELLHLPTFTWRKVSMPGKSDVVALTVFAYTASRASRERRHDAVMVMGGCAVPSGRVAYYAPFAQVTWQAVRAGVRAPSLHQRMFGRFALWLERRALARTRVLLPTSVKIGEELERLLPADALTVVVPGGVDVEEFPPVAPTDRAAGRRSLGIDEDGFFVAMIGEFSTGRKGLEVLAAAVAEGPSDEAILVHGEGPVEATKARLGHAASRLVFIDPKLPVRTVLAATDVAAIPSLYEPFSLVALEAASSQLPIVISDRAGAASYLKGASVAVDPGSPEDIRRALDGIRADPEGARSMAAEARRIALSMTWDHIGAMAADEVEKLARGEV